MGDNQGSRKLGLPVLDPYVTIRAQDLSSQTPEFQNVSD